MPRVKRGVTARARHKKVLALAKGFRGRRGNVFRIAKEAVMKAGQYAYRDRRTKKRVFRQLWIARINAAARELGMTYSQNMKLVVLPQAFRNMLPVLLTQTIILFQDTSLVYAVGEYDLLKGFEVAGKNFNRPVETYLVAAVVYFVICFAASRLVRRLQNRIAIR